MRASILLVRWSLRDLRARWVQVLAIALILGVGTGIYSGLSSTSSWRRASFDASYEHTRMYDLRVRLASGNFADAAALRRAAASIPHATLLAAVAPRLIGPTQVDGSIGDRTILTPGAVIGVDLATSAPGSDGVSTLEAVEGRALTTTDAGQPIALIDPEYARARDLPPTGSIVVSGQHRLDYVGEGFTPEYFVAVDDQTQLRRSPSEYAPVFTSIETAQALLDRPGQANDLVVRVSPGADRQLVRSELEAALTAAFPGVGTTWATTEEDPARTLLFDTVDSTQHLYTVFAALLLAGAAFGAFNLTARIVAAQRREIGVAMALGTPTAQIAVRPIIFGFEVAVLGVLLGVGLGVTVNGLLGSVLRQAAPLPVWRTAFEPRIFLQGAAIGVALIVIAITYPIVRAVRVTPLQAIRTVSTPRSPRLLGRGVIVGSRRSRHTHPGHSVARLPWRDLVRSPQRTILTILGIAATVTVLVALLGLVDSIDATIADVRSQIAAAGTGRVTVTLDRFHPVGDTTVDSIASSDVVERSGVEIEVPATIRKGAVEFPLLLAVLDFAHGPWQPVLAQGRATSDGPGVVLSDKAAADLGASVGDTVTMHHPRRDGLSYRLVDTELPVLGITRLATRSVAFADVSAAAELNLDGLTNVMTVVAKPGVPIALVQRTLFALPGVAGVQEPTALVDASRRQLDEVVSILRIVDAALIGLAVLIAFNSASIAADERAREHATMFAFGLPVHTVLGVAAAETAIIGIAATVLGILAGREMLTWLIERIVPAIVPEIGLTNTLPLATAVFVLVLGTLAVAVTPLLSSRRLTRMNIPATLRIVE